VCSSVELSLYRTLLHRHRFISPRFTAVYVGLKNPAVLDKTEWANSHTGHMAPGKTPWYWANSVLTLCGRETFGPCLKSKIFLDRKCLSWSILALKNRVRRKNTFWGASCYLVGWSGHGGRVYWRQGKTILNWALPVGDVNWSHVACLVENRVL
jgi:hypothetical protein